MHFEACAVVLPRAQVFSFFPFGFKRLRSKEGKKAETFLP
jgi:hypothetical protein